MLNNAGSEVEGSTITMERTEDYLDNSRSRIFIETKRWIAEYPVFAPEVERAQLERYAKLRKELKDSNNGNVSKIEDQINEIENEFVCRNGGLILKQYSKIKDPAKFADADDLIQEGRWAIVWALRKFDLAKIGGNKKFSTYACWWLKSFMERYQRENRSVMRVSASTHWALSKLNCPLPLTEKAVRARCEELGYKEQKTKALIAAVRAASQESLDEEPENCKNGYQKLSNNDWEATRRRVENRLLVTEVSKKILKYYKEKNIRDFGMFMLKAGVLGCGMTLEEVGKIFNISRERVRQITDGVRRNVVYGRIGKLDISEISDKELATSLTDLCELPYLLCENLSEREYRLVCLRFGIALIDNKPCPLSEIAETLKTNTEQVEQELDTIMEKLEVLLIDDPNTNTEITVSEYLSNLRNFTK
ncbi:sigma-70 family RNA polymerase sigma factor [bacterium]|nr:sigma-70 family RNA polymerase sigma factor [bacterium]